MANVLKRERQVQAISMLVEGSSIRSVERVTGIHRDTIMRLGLRVGQHCERFHDERVRGVQCQYAQCDEIWAYVGKKEKRVRPGDAEEVGDAYTYVGMDQDSKLVISYLCGKRDEGHTHEFVRDLAQRIDGGVQISTDGWTVYPEAVREHFNGRAAYGQIVKSYGGTPTDGPHRYSPPRMSVVKRVGMWGMPRSRYISTSHVERQNLTMRMQMRRFTRLTNAFSKKLENLRAAVALHFAWYNFVRIHRALGTTPAMAAGLSGTLLTMENLLP